MNSESFKTSSDLLRIKTELNGFLLVLLSLPLLQLFQLDNELL